jgi:hypothetical protein
MREEAIRWKSRRGDFPLWRPEVMRFSPIRHSAPTRRIISRNRAMVVWPFTDLADERFRVGRRMMRLHQRQGLPFKIGLRHPEGWAAYVLGDHLFIKSVPLIERATYPDMGSNFETFTNAEFLELETLGPLKRVSAGEIVAHHESWLVFSGVRLPNFEDEDAFLEALEPYREQLSQS